MAGKQAKGVISESDDDDNQEQTTAEQVEVENEPEVSSEPDVEIVEGTDERLAADEADDDKGEETPEKPERHKETAAERRARAKLAKERDKKELDFQRRVIKQQEERLRALESRQSETQVTVLDSRLAAALNEVEQFERIHSAAVTKADGESATQALQFRDKAKERAFQILQEKQRLANPAPAEPAFAPMAREFASEHPWYDSQGSNEDSAIVLAIDNVVAREGFDPNTSAYWSELKKRVAARLPHRFERAQTADDVDDEPEPQPRTRRGPPVGGSSRTAPTSASRIVLSPERVQAMKESGAWDDPVLRVKMAKAYADYDKQNAANR